MSAGSQDPGAARQGNFINYYSFNPAEKRTRLIPRDAIQKHATNGSNQLLGLDVGCNTGVLTRSVADHFAAEDLSLHIRGVDVDPLLIERAKEAKDDRVSFQHLDVTGAEAEDRLRSFLKERGRSKFDVVFCFSVTMWIHLNHGDVGLDKFIARISGLTDLVLLEPQPWKCYRTASRRMRKLGQPDFEHLKALERDVDGGGTKVEQHVLAMCERHGLKVVDRFGETDWKRQLVLLKKES